MKHSRPMMCVCGWCIVVVLASDKILIEARSIVKSSHYYIAHLKNCICIYFRLNAWAPTEHAAIQKCNNNFPIHWQPEQLNVDMYCLWNGFLSLLLSDMDWLSRNGTLSWKHYVCLTGLHTWIAHFNVVDWYWFGSRVNVLSPLPCVWAWTRSFAHTWQDITWR